MVPIGPVKRLERTSLAVTGPDPERANPLWGCARVAWLRMPPGRRIRRGLSICFQEWLRATLRQVQPQMGGLLPAVRATRFANQGPPGRKGQKGLV